MIIFLNLIIDVQTLNLSKMPKFKFSIVVFYHVACYVSTYVKSSSILVCKCLRKSMLLLIFTFDKKKKKIKFTIFIPNQIDFIEYLHIDFILYSSH